MMSPPATAGVPCQPGHVPAEMGYGLGKRLEQCLKTELLRFYRDGFLTGSTFPLDIHSESKYIYSVPNYH